MDFGYRVCFVIWVSRKLIQEELRTTKSSLDLLNMIGLFGQGFNMGKVRDVSLDAKLYYICIFLFPNCSQQQKESYGCLRFNLYVFEVDYGSLFLFHL